MKAIKVLMIALMAAFTVSTVSAQTTPAKPVVKTEHKATMKHHKKKSHRKHHAKKAMVKP